MTGAGKSRALCGQPARLCKRRCRLPFGRMAIAGVRPSINTIQHGGGFDEPLNLSAKALAGCEPNCPIGGCASEPAVRGTRERLPRRAAMMLGNEIVE